MKTRISIAVSVIVGCVVLISMFFAPESKSQQEVAFAETEIPVMVKPLKSGDSVIPVDIQCEPVFTKKPDTVENYSCFFVNNANKGIRAFGILHTLLFDADGKMGRTGRLYVTHPYIHQDMSDGKEPFGPGSKRYIGPPGPVTQPGSVLKALELAPVYIEFSDGTSAGSDAESIEMIAKIRDGAARYKQALREEYLRKGKSAMSIVPRLQDSFSGDGKSSWTLQERSGANAYRRFLLEKYENAGPAAIEKILID